jgi:hypothetical protein
MAEGATVDVDCSVVGTLLQDAVESAEPGDILNVLGTCNENILIRNERRRITIDGGGTATVIGSDPGSPVFNVRGKGILIQAVIINGGSVGVHVNRGSNAVLNNNTIRQTNGNGVVIDELAFAVLTNNLIQQNPGAGVVVSENSTARIGFNADSETAASSNMIQQNAVGVVISNNSSARIIDNRIRNNDGNGVVVIRDSNADIASNAISGNDGDGILVAENSTVQLGEDTGTSIYESPNTTMNDNDGFGIRCASGSTADGRLGGLTGDSGASSFDPSCIDSLMP